MKPWLKIVLPLLVLVLGIGLTVVLIVFQRKASPEEVKALPPLIDVAVVTNEPYQFRVVTQGTVEPRTKIQLSAEVAGRIETVSPSLDSGGFFEKDELLLEIDPRDFELAVVQAQARVEEARFQLQREEAEAEVARSEWERLGEGKPNPLLLREPQMARARATLAASQASLEQASRDLERCRIKAPFAGRVGQKLVDKGQFITRGAPVAHIYAVDYAEVRLPLSPAELAYVDLPLDFRGESQSAPRTRVLLRAALAGKAHEWEGYIDRMEGEMDVSTRMLFAVARVKNPYGRGSNSERPPLASGLFVEAEILGIRLDSTVVLPRSVLRRNNEVLVLDPDLRLHRRQVDVWRTDRSAVVIRSGLEPGERVCLSSLEVFTDRMRVRTNALAGAARDASPVEPGSP